MTTRRFSGRCWRLAPALLWLAVACQTRDAPREAARPAAAVPPAPRAPAAVAAPTRPRIVALGDSLTAGSGLSEGEAYPALLQQRIDAAGYPFDVVNAGVSGDTSAGGASRIDWTLDGDVRVLIVALGGNDGLRGLPVVDMKRNLAGIIERARERRIDVLLAGMETLTNMGPEYQREFRAVFPQLAGQYKVACLPFLLDGVAGRPELNQHDGIHPTAEGTRVVADNLWRVLEPMLKARR